jgi:hypothetical protein
MRTIVDHTMFMGSAMADFVEAMDDDERAEVFVLWLWMRAMQEDAADGVIKLTPARIKRITRGYAPDPEKVLKALVSAKLLVKQAEADYYYLANWDEMNGEFFRGKTRKAGYMRAYRARKRAEEEAALEAQCKGNVTVTETTTLPDCNDYVPGSVSVAVAVSESHKEDPTAAQKFDATHQAATNPPPAKPEIARACEVKGNGVAMVTTAATPDEVIHPAQTLRGRNEKARLKLAAEPLPLVEHTMQPLTGGDIERLIVNTYGITGITIALQARDFVKLAREEPFTWSDLNHAVEEARQRDPLPADPAKYIVKVLVNARRQVLADRHRRPRFEKENLETAAALGVLDANRKAVFADTVNPGDPDF